ncbi:hypothetical protein [Spongiactinospora sp. TRM90649]|uniref:hypothetical protein n=1 Tax=Spongiactinospora sp. TRM90649 TaxID=3031114 RepID=UPI0023F8F783|nr:hypothetical protein [Spongiactinospora sp. TRM90649]MDF5758571.1 hypothetical protein [Spongiactinospora sp. TRM90649]
MNAVAQAACWACVLAASWLYWRPGYRREVAQSAVACWRAACRAARAATYRSQHIPGRRP